MIESPKDFAARIYGMMEAGAAGSGSGAAAASGTAPGAPSGAAAPAVDPEVL